MVCGITSSELIKDIKIYPQILKNIRVASKPAARQDVEVMETVARIGEELGEEGRILLRESGTEPVIRVMVEAGSDALCQQYADEVTAVLKRRGHVVNE